MKSRATRKTQIIYRGSQNTKRVSYRVYALGEEPQGRRFENSLEILGSVIDYPYLVKRDPHQSKGRIQ